jgi:DNA-binding FadR family transcriptional regulator
MKTKGLYARPNLTVQIASDLGIKIVSGQMVEGEILPTEAALGTLLGVSRTAIREAIKVLASKGLVEVRRKTGTRVRSSREWNALDPDVITWQFEGDAPPAGLKDLLELRRIIEPVCASLAAERSTPAELEEIEKAFDEMQSSVGKTAAAVEADLRFHLAILEATHNVFMRPFGALIQAALRASFRRTNADVSAYRESLLKHRAVLAAIRDHLPETAESAMLSMLQGTQRDIRHVIGDKRKPATATKKKKASRKRSK